MIKHAIIIALLAAAPAAQTGSDAPVDTGQPARTSAEQREPPQPRGQTPTSRPQPFEPSREIDADSQVTFPADI